MPKHRGSRPKNYKCLICASRCMEKHIECKKCHRRNGHPSCIQEVRKDIANYICDNCDLPRNTYLAECIFEHTIKNSKRYFQVMWRGYKTPTLELESNLKHCISLVNEYCRKIRIPISVYPELAGRAQATVQTLANWTTTNQVVQAARKLLTKHNLTTPVSECIPGRTLDKNTIYVLNTQSQFFVMYKEEDTIRLSDGGNLYLTCPRTRKHIDCKVGSQITPIKSECQTQENFCGSAAVLRACEMAEKVKSRQPWSTLIPTSSTKHRVEKQLHRTKQRQKIPDEKISIWLRCPYCNKPYKKGKRRNYNSHVQQCKKEKEIIDTLPQELISELT